MEVVTMVLRDIQMYCAVDRIFLADTQAATRNAMRAVEIYEDSIPQDGGHDQTEKKPGALEDTGNNGEGLFPDGHDGMGQAPG